MFNTFEKKYNHLKIDINPELMQIIPIGLDKNYNIINKEFSVNIPRYFKKLHANNLNLKLLGKYSNLVLGEQGIPIFRIKNNKIINFYETTNVSNNEKIIFTKIIKNNKIQNNDLILGCTGVGLHLTNLDLFKFLFKKYPILSHNRVFNNQLPIEYILNQTISLPNTKILKLISNNIIKKVIASTGTIHSDLTPHIPDGLRATIHTNMWGLETSLKDLLNMVGLSSNFGYTGLNGNIGLYFIIEPNNLNYVCRTFNENFNTTLTNIGKIYDGNRGEKVKLILY
ncbi:MAG: hypothetical protein CO106_03130 [Deltaproteobacteria bacterium CG_4_9_14_3_um_filter_44_9]|nr:MAG: hypothetical protein CO106_03130 [Deltaproteobacteria bacterium CG_4_9_14_3_um_filter_44_9]